MTIEIRNREYQIITLDFETYYDTAKVYSLKSPFLNLSEYIRHELFKAHGVGIKIEQGNTRWYTGAKIEKEIQKIDWDNTALLCHNTYFDGFILHEHYGVHPGFYMDTMCMALAAHGANSKAGLDFLARLHGLSGKTKAHALVNTLGKRDLSKEELKALGEYCADDCDDTYALFHKLYTYVPDDELRLIDLTLRMFCDPVIYLDEARCRAEYDREVREKQEAIEFVKELCTVTELQSNEKFADLLRAQGVEPPMKISLTTQKPTYAFAKTDFDFVDLMENGTPVVQALCSARVRNKTTTNETRALRFLEAGKCGAPIPVYLKYCGAHTFRWSGGNKLNLQNLMRGGELRRSLLAPPGYRLVVADSAQIEARTLAWLSGEHAIIEAFANKRDVYKMMASAIYNVPEDQVDKEQRFVGKVCLGDDTLVLTDRGWVPIIEVLVTDLVWDGIEWVEHGGLVHNGLAATLNWKGITATADHEILTERGWVEWFEVLTSPSLFQSALSSASLPLQDLAGLSINLENALVGSPPHNVVADGPGMLPDTTSSLEEQLDAMVAPRSRPTKNVSGNTERSYQTTPIGLGYSTAYRRAYLAVTAQATRCLSTMASGVLQFLKSGDRIAANFLSTLFNWTAGINPSSNSTGSTSIKVMNPVTSDLSVDGTTSGINEKSKMLKRKTDVYDLNCCGPRNRFMILSHEGPLIVHNCVLGLGYGMGGSKLNDTLAKGAMGPKVVLPTEETTRIVAAYRAANKAIVNMWRRAEEILIDMILGNTGSYGPLTWGKGHIKMPNGLFMQYANLSGEIRYDRSGRARLSDAWYEGKRGIKTYIYGGSATENWVQSLARCIVAGQMLTISERYRVVTMSHDEIVCLAKEDEADECLRFMIETMSTAPPWAEGLPLAAEGGHDVCYSK